MTGWSLRPAEAADVPGIAAIYGRHVAEGFASFEEVPPEPAEMARRRETLVAGGFPYLVAVDAAGAVLGYAYAGPYRPRSAYRFTVEDSIYIAPEAAGKGVGRALLTRLIEECRALGYRQIVAVIGDSANLPSINLHRALGFEPAGLLRHVGLKKGRWLDSVLMQLSL